MDFPDCSFPYRLHKSCEKRELFLSCGSHDNININSVEEKSFFPQKIPEGFGNKKNSFKAKKPALPLYDSPEPVQYPLVDRVTDALIEEKNEITDLIKKLKYSRGIVNTKSNWTKKYAYYIGFHEMKSRLDKLKCGEDITDQESKKFLPSQCYHMIQLYDKYKFTTEIQKVNSKYTDGCLSYCGSSESGYIISPCADFHTLKISFVTYDEKEDAVKVANTKSINTDDEINGVTSCYTRNKGYVLTRHSTECRLYMLNEDCHMLHTDTLQIGSGNPSSLCISPYIEGENLIATDEGSVYLWSVNAGKDEVIKQKTQRFYCRDQWRQATFSSHPRQIVVSDCTTVELFDLRKKSNRSIDLFALPSKFLHPNERIRIIKQHSPFLYVVATDYSLVVTDERFPGHPLLQWQHLLRTPPQYLSVLSDIGIERQSLISVASQNPMEAFCYMFQGGVHKTLQGVGSPWKLSRPDDFTKWDDICTGTDTVATEYRYGRNSLLGLQCVKHQNGFVAYQLDCYGDVYYQPFNLTNQNGDKTFAAGPGMNDLQLDSRTIQKGKDWVKAINNIWCKPGDDSSSVWDISKYFEEVILEKPSHMLCSLCHGENYNNPESKRNNSADRRENTEYDFCHSCRHNLKTGKSILEGAAEDRVCSISTNELTSLPLVSSLPSDILSQIISRVWKEESVYDLLEQRDEEVKKKLEKRKELQKKTSDIGSINDESLPPIPAVFNMDKTLSQSIEESKNGDRLNEQQGNSSDSDVDEHDSETDTGKETLVDFLSKDTRKLENIPSTSVTQDDILVHLASGRQRHSSLSSLSSVRSSSVVRSTQLDTLPGFVRSLNSPLKKHAESEYDSDVSDSPGFMKTRLGKFKLSRRKHKETDNDISGVDLMDEEFLSQESIKSVQMFTNVIPQNLTTKFDSPRKKLKTDSGIESPYQPFVLPYTSTKKVKKKFMSGF